MIGKKKILIVDDEVDFADMLKMRLEANGYDVVAAHDGEEGIAAAQAENPSLILLDVMMPGLDGYQTLKRLKATRGTEYIPVVMLTAKGETKSIFKAQDIGVTDYLIKPCDSKELLEVLSKHT